MNIEGTECETYKPDPVLEAAGRRLHEALYADHRRAVPHVLAMIRRHPQEARRCKVSEGLREAAAWHTESTPDDEVADDLLRFSLSNTAALARLIAANATTLWTEEFTAGR